MPNRILLYDDLMIVAYLLRRESFTWEQITHAQATLVRQQGIPVLRLALQSDDGRKLSLGEMPKEIKQRPGAAVPRIGIDQLIDGVLEVTAPARYQSAIRRYDQGQPVEFNKLQISQAGITARGQTISWPLVADIQANDSHMVVKAIGQERPWGVFAQHELPNADVLPAVIAHARGTGFSAFQGIDQTPALEEARRASRRRNRLIYWLLFPLLAIGLNLGLNYGSYYFSAQANYDRGTEALTRGDFATALQEFDEAVRKEPQESFYYVERGRVHYLRNDYAAARRELDAALAINPADPRAIGLKGMVMYQQRQFNEAIQMYTVALEQQPGLMFAYCQRGLSYMALRQFNKARADFLRCRQSDDPMLQAEANLRLNSLPPR